MPNVVILAGPNGAGKTSAAPTLLRDELRVAEFVNADVIARGLSGFSANAVAVEAGRIMLRRLDELSASDQDFAFETTLSGNAFLAAMERWRLGGYTIRIVYLWVRSPEIAIDRVHARAKQGGHIVPDEVIRRRYDRGLLNFANRYRHAADRWHVYDNTDPLDRRAVAHGSTGVVEVVDDGLWERFQEQVSQVPRIREVLMADRAPVADDHIERWLPIRRTWNVQCALFTRVSFADIGCSTSL